MFSNSPQQQQDNQNEHHQTQTTAWIIAPTVAVRPRWQRANQQENQKNQDNRRDTHKIMNLLPDNSFHNNLQMS
jgi:hypothetical protein